MSHHNQGLPLRDTLQVLHKLRFSLRIHGTGGLVEQQQ